MTLNERTNEHARAIGLLAEAADGLSAGDTAWLQRHLAECPECSNYAELQRTVTSALKSVSVLASPSLVAATQARLQLRAAQLHESQARRTLISISITLGVATSISWGFALWNVWQWVQRTFELTAFAANSAIVVFSTLMLSPLSLVVAYFLLVRRTGKTSTAQAAS